MYEEIFISITVNVNFYFILSVIFKCFLCRRNMISEMLGKRLKSEIKIKKSKVVAGLSIDFLAEEGDIKISKSNFFASKSIFAKTEINTCFEMNDLSSLKTENTVIEVNSGIINAKNGGEISQKDGNITFRAR